MIYSFVYLSQSHPLKEFVLKGFEMFCTIGCSDQTLIEVIDDWVDLGLKKQLSDEEMFTLRSINQVFKDYLGDEQVFLDYLSNNEYNLFEIKIKEAEECNYLQSQIDFVIFHGLVLCSWAFSGIPYNYRINKLGYFIEILNRLGETDSIYRKLLESKRHVLLGNENKARLICEKLKDKIDQKDCALRLLVDHILLGAYYGDSIKYQTILEEGMESNCFFWEYANKLVYLYLRQSNYLKAQELGDVLVSMLASHYDNYSIGLKLSLLSNVITATFRIGQNTKLKKYIIEYKKTLDLLPEDGINYKFNFDFALGMINSLYNTYFEDETTANYEKTELMKFGRNVYFNMLYATIVLNQSINQKIIKTEYFAAFELIKELKKGKGYSNGTDNTIFFLENYYLSVIIDRSLQWKGMNILNYKGTQVEVALKYLKKAKRKIMEERRSLIISAVFHEVLLRSRLDNVNKVDYDEIQKILDSDGYDYVLALMAVLYYYVNTNDKLGYKQTRDILYAELERYSNYNFYNYWKNQVDTICSYYEMNLKIQYANTKIHLDITVLNEYARFLQSEVNRQLAGEI